MTDQIADVEVQVEPDLSTFGARLRAALNTAFRGSNVDVPVDEAGQRISKRLTDTISKGILKADIVKGIAKALLKPAGLGLLVAVGARWAAVLGSGLVPYLAQLGPVMAGAATAGAAGLLAVVPGLLAVKSAFKGIKEENKEFFKDLGKPFKAISEAGRKELMPALKESAKNLEALIPSLSKFSAASNKSVGNLMRFVSAQLALKGSRKELDSFLEASSGGFDKLTKGLGSLISNLIPSLSSLNPIIEKVSTNIGNVLDRLGKYIRTLSASGELEARFNRWYDAAARFGNALRDYLIGAWNVLKIAFGGANDFTKSMEANAAAFREWTESFTGQNKIKAFFENVREPTEEFGRLIKDVGSLLKESFVGDTGNMTDFLREIRTEFIPAFRDFQEVIRESGIQDALYDLAAGLLSLMEAGGGGGMAAFVTVLAQLAEALAAIMSIPGVGQIAGTLLAIAGAMKAFALVKTAGAAIATWGTSFGTAMGLVSASAAGAAADAAGSVTAITTGTEKEAKKGGNRLMVAGRGMGSKLTSGIRTGIRGVGPAAVATMVAGAVVNPIVDSIRGLPTEADQQMGELTKRMTQGGTSLSAAMEGVANSTGMVTWKSILGGKGEWGGSQMFSNGAQDALSTMTDKLQDMDSWANRALNTMWTMIPGTEDLFAGVEEDFSAIQSSIAEISATDPELAKQFAEQLKQSLINAGYSAEEAQAKIQGLLDTITASTAAQSIEFTGDFSSIDSALASFNIQFGETTQNKLISVAAEPGSIDAVTGKLSELGQERVAKVLAEADLGSINGVDGALSAVAKERIAKIIADPESINAEGELTKTARKRIAKILAEPENIETTKEKLDRLAANRTAYITAKLYRIEGLNPDGTAKQSVAPGVGTPVPSFGYGTLSGSSSSGIGLYGSSGSGVGVPSSTRTVAAAASYGSVVNIEQMVVRKDDDVRKFADRVGFAVRTSR